ncbi:PREDICTED: uncharacterized protein LOC108560230 [Nicrophorus vespilloides]|uniref:Uncharacterized protein LOC108560230 n=1 Tax=Nicrophorus vespilloides TaxID=110193 RepID=A0ABM1MF27_NICVS|nr:PREDICTED: uncharacterized protein LOC108560230 [Nicrophorus vespilloides]
MNKNKSTQKIVLKRQRQNVIQQNLEHLEQHTLKKKFAQQKYYESKAGISPLKKKYAQQPVHDRLGSNSPTSQVPVSNNVRKTQKLKQRVAAPNNGIITRRYRQFTNSNLIKLKAQNRLNVIKQNGNIELNGNPRGKVILKRNRVLNKSNVKPLNLTIQLKNTEENGTKYRRHSMKASLNPKLQKEIQIVQSQCTENCVVPNMTIALRDVGYTKMSLHERFSDY